MRRKDSFRRALGLPGVDGGALIPDPGGARDAVVEAPAGDGATTSTANGGGISTAAPFCSFQHVVGILGGIIGFFCCTLDERERAARQ
jgi:hypothetical protein